MKNFLAFMLIFTTLQWESQCRLLIADRTMSKMIEFTSKSPFCYLYTDRDFIQDTILKTEQRKVKITSDEEIEKLEEVCKRKQLRTSYQGGFIYPGTKWCGPGAVAQNYSDLGNHRREDMCCREHDNCPQSLERGECKQGICNKSPFTRSHCDCDATFRRCLQNVNSETANTIGAIFFNVIQVICFKQRSPCSELQRNGYTKEEADRVCSQWKYRPSAKYFPLMSLQTR
ncbi:hypothetical protein ILUMI_05353 [Ignelater luminosus]|uniref:Phospholipase A2 n=1 Tax=Ignelater luminosus TaxID=2038154 RepID=A0A8K0DAM1_IGNLU|nr:hypothetical protein ILUMI_05353 [Ignelater luminosus]